MRCTDCIYSKETIPAQLHYVYCSKFKKEMSVVTEFKDCQYKETDEYKLKEAIQNYCNDEGNWIVAVDQINLLNSLANKFDIPNFIQDVIARRRFENEVFRILSDSEIKIETCTLVQEYDEGEERNSLLILQKPKT